MEAGGSPPGPDPPERIDVVHEGARARVTRLFLPGGTVIRKEPLGADAPRRLRHELGILGRLRGVSGVAQLLDAPKYPDLVVLADVGGVSLAAVPTPLSGAELVGLAVALARVVAGTLAYLAPEQTGRTGRAVVRRHRAARAQRPRGGARRAPRARQPTRGRDGSHSPP